LWFEYDEGDLLGM